MNDRQPRLIEDFSSPSLAGVTAIFCEAVHISCPKPRSPRFNQMDDRPAKAAHPLSSATTGSPSPFPKRKRYAGHNRVRATTGQERMKTPSARLGRNVTAFRPLLISILRLHRRFPVQNRRNALHNRCACRTIHSAHNIGSTDLKNRRTISSPTTASIQKNLGIVESSRSRATCEITVHR